MYVHIHVLLLYMEHTLHDSGTEFMVKLHEQLQFFVASKVSTDRLWQGVRIYLSGHEVGLMQLL